MCGEPSSKNLSQLKRCPNVIYEDFIYEDIVYEDITYDDIVYEDIIYEDIIYKVSFRCAENQIQEHFLTQTSP